jgi:hypothetical protein
MVNQQKPKSSSQQQQQRHKGNCCCQVCVNKYKYMAAVTLSNAMNATSTATTTIARPSKPTKMTTTTSTIANKVVKRKIDMLAENLAQKNLKKLKMEQSYYVDYVVDEDDVEESHDEAYRDDVEESHDEEDTYANLIDKIHDEPENGDTVDGTLEPKPDKKPKKFTYPLDLTTSKQLKEKKTIRKQKSTNDSDLSSDINRKLSTNSRRKTDFMSGMNTDLLASYQLNPLAAFQFFQNSTTNNGNHAAAILNNPIFAAAAAATLAAAAVSSNTFKSKH